MVVPFLFPHWHSPCCLLPAVLLGLQVVVDAREGLLFRCIRDRKVVAVDPQVRYRVLYGVLYGVLHWCYTGTALGCL